MTVLRPMRRTDVGGIADLFHRRLRHRSGPAPVKLAAYLEHYYFQTSDREEAQSLVSMKDGAVIGFLGLRDLPMTLDKRPIRVIQFSSLVVDGGQSTVAAQLIRSAKIGDDELAISDTASSATTAMWKSRGGFVMPSYSLDWLRVIRPLGFASAVGARKIALLHTVGAAVAPIDRWLQGRGKLPEHWGLAPTRHGSGLKDQLVSKAQCALLLRSLSSSFRLAPNWGKGELERMLDEAETKSWFGTMSCHAVSTAGGQPLGVYVQHARPGGVAQVLQLLAEPGRLGLVFDRMLETASEAGNVAITGRAEPTLLSAISGRGLVFVNRASSVAKTNSPEIRDALLGGSALITGFAGETWSSLNGNELD